MSFDPLSLLISSLVGSAGFVAFVYGKKQGRLPQIVTGIVLMVFPYFVPNPWVTLGIGAGLMSLMTLAVRGGY